MRIQTLLRAGLSGSVLLQAAHAQYVMVCDQSNDQVSLLSASTGAVVNASFIVDDQTGITYNFDGPFEALQVYDQIWVSENLNDQIVRFDQFGMWIATITAQLDGPRGMAFQGGKVYVLNFGTANSAPGKAVIVYSPQGAQLATFPLVDAYDLIARNGELLVSNTLLDDLQRWSTTGSLLGTFHNSDGISGVDFPTQLHLTSTGSVLTGGLVAPLGLFAYDAGGVQTNYWPTISGCKGVLQLASGKLLYTDSANVSLFDPVANTTTPIIANVTAYYLNFLTPPVPPTTYCTAGTSGSGCVASIGFTGTPFATASSGFTIRADFVEGVRQGLLFYGVNGRVALQWAAGSTSFLCVRIPTQRTPAHSSGGTVNNCDGLLSVDWSAFMANNPGALGNPLFGGALIDAQAWYRDPASPKTTSLSNALEFYVVP